MKTITPEMLELHRKLVNIRNVSDSSASQYIRNLYSLNNQRPFTNLSWLKSKNIIHTRLSDFAKSTQKSMVGCIVSVLSLYKDSPAYKKIYNYWYNIMQSTDENGDTSKMTEKQEDNWLDWNIVLSHRDELLKDCDKFINAKSLTPTQYEKLLHLVVLSLYTDFPPRRNQDYQQMMVVKKWNENYDVKLNYLDMENKKFIFNKYKTAKNHGQQIFDVPDSLMEIFKFYFKFHPNVSKHFYLLSNYSGQPILVVNGITRILNKIFGKNVGASMLRHIYLSNKYNVDEMNEDSDKMAHNPDMQREYMKSQSVDIPEI